MSATRARDSGGFGNLGDSLTRLHAKAAIVDGRQLSLGSVNLSGRSSLYNTELGVVVESEPLVRQARSLLERDANRSFLRVRLAANGTDLQRVGLERDGRETVYDDEPDDGWWKRLKLRLLSVLDERWL